MFIIKIDENATIHQSTKSRFIDGNAGVIYHLERIITMRIKISVIIKDRSHC